MNHRTPSPVASRLGRSPQSECPSCDGLSCSSARRSVPAVGVRADAPLDADVPASPPQHAAQSVRTPHASALQSLLTIEQVAEALQVSPKTIRRLLVRGFPHVRFGRVLRFEPADVHRWIVARRS